MKHEHPIEVIPPRTVVMNRHTPRALPPEPETGQQNPMAVFIGKCLEWDARRQAAKAIEPQ